MEKSLPHWATSDSLKYLWLHNEVAKGLGNNSFTSIAAGVGGLADTLIQIALNGNPWADDACVPAEPGERSEE